MPDRVDSPDVPEPFCEWIFFQHHMLFPEFFIVGFAGAEAPVLGCVLVGNCWRVGRHVVIRIKSSRPVTFGASLLVRIAIVSVPRVVVDSAVVPELLLCVCPLYGLCQVGMQFFAAMTTALYTIAATWAVLKMTAAMVGGLRVTEEDETQGLDLSLHEETGYRY